MKKKTIEKRKTVNKNFVQQKKGNTYPPLALTNLWSREAAKEVIAAMCLLPYQIKFCKKVVELSKKAAETEESPLSLTS